MKRKMGRLKFGATAILGAMTVAVILIAALSLSGIACVVGGTLMALGATSSLVWRNRKRALAWLDGVIGENPVAIVGIAVVFLFLCVAGGGVIFGSKAVGDLIYGAGVLMVFFIAFCVWRLTDHINPARREAEKKSARDAADNVIPIGGARREGGKASDSTN